MRVAILRVLGIFRRGAPGGSRRTIAGQPSPRGVLLLPIFLATLAPIAADVAPAAAFTGDAGALPARATSAGARPREDGSAALERCLRAEASIATDARRHDRCTALASVRLNDLVTLEGIQKSVDGPSAEARPASPPAALDSPSAATLRTDAFILSGKLTTDLGLWRPFVSGGLGLSRTVGDFWVAGNKTDAGGIGFSGRVAGGLDLEARDDLTVTMATTYMMGSDTGGGTTYLSIGLEARYRF